MYNIILKMLFCTQVTLLHVYHHAIMPAFGWIQMRYLPGGHETFSALMNCCVHIVMYTYYLLSAFGPKMQPYLWWKKYLTALQLLQVSKLCCKVIPLTV